MVELACLENKCADMVPRVRIPLSPPEFNFDESKAFCMQKAFVFNPIFLEKYVIFHRHTGMSAR